MTQYVFTILFTAFVTLALTWGVWQLSLRFKLYPGIRERDVHKTPTPRLGGVAMFLGVLAAFGVSAANPFFDIVWANPTPVLAILGATFIIVVVGVVDDLWDLDWMIKLGMQFLAAGIVALFGVQIFSLPIGGLTVGSSWASISLTIFAIVLVMNAVNFIDGLDGLVAGVCLIANGVFFVYSYLLVRETGSTTFFNLASLMAAVLIGVCLGFLPMNWHPAKLFMGDAGALMLGLLMATSAIAVTGQLDPAILDPDVFGRSQLLGAFIPILLPVAVVLLPLLDFGMAVLRRMAAGKSPFSPDRKHLHHRMLDLGHSSRDAVLIFYAWTAIVAFAFLLMFMPPPEWLSWVRPTYLLGIIYGVIGIAACLVLTMTPSGKKKPVDAAAPAVSDADTQPAPPHRTTPVEETS